MKLIIDNEYTRYGGDNYGTLYLDRGINGNIQLCLEIDGEVSVKHLTSSDEGYQKWLALHHSSLMLISEKEWYQSPERTDGGEYHWEFHYIRKQLAEQAR